VQLSATIKGQYSSQRARPRVSRTGSRKPRAITRYSTTLPAALTQRLKLSPGMAKRDVLVPELPLRYERPLSRLSIFTLFISGTVKLHNANSAGAIQRQRNSRIICLPCWRGSAASPIASTTARCRSAFMITTGSAMAGGRLFPAQTQRPGGQMGDHGQASRNSSGCPEWLFCRFCRFSALRRSSHRPELRP
jgi:hypothetical protein